MYLLRAIGSKDEHGLVTIGQGNTVHEWPYMTKAAGRELHTWSEAELGVTRKL